jgi:hypothetical protein
MSDVDGYNGNDGDDVDPDEDEQASQANDRSMQNVEDCGHSSLVLGTCDVAVYESEHGDYADANEEE